MTATEQNRPRRMGSCDSCYHFNPLRMDYGTCRRFPQFVDRYADDYCSEYKSFDKRDTATLADPYDMWEVTK